MEKVEIEETVETGRRIYEVGFHIVTLVSEENLAAEVGIIKDIIESAGGITISEEFPKLRSLAYPISKTIDGHKHNFNEGYFGWVKFEVEPAETQALMKALKSNKNILRFILVETVRENTMSHTRPIFRKEGESLEEPVVLTAEVPKEITPEDEERINKSIEELVNE